MTSDSLSPSQMSSIKAPFTISQNKRSYRQFKYQDLDIYGSKYQARFKKSKKQKKDRRSDRRERSQDLVYELEKFGRRKKDVSRKNEKKFSHKRKQSRNRRNKHKQPRYEHVENKHKKKYPGSKNKFNSFPVQGKKNSRKTKFKEIEKKPVENQKAGDKEKGN